MTPSSIIPNNSERNISEKFLFRENVQSPCHTVAFRRLDSAISFEMSKSVEMTDTRTKIKRLSTQTHALHALHSNLQMHLFSIVRLFYLRTAKQLAASHAMSIIKSSWTKMHARKIKASLQRRQKVFAKISSSFSVELDCSDCAS